ncbi:MAG: hypothetical protein ABIJ12_11535 [bacterium]
MTYMLCRNRVKDFDKWFEIFSSHKDAHEIAGLYLENLWCSIDDPNEVFFLFTVESMERADLFVNDPASAKLGEEAGVLEGDIHYIEDFGS